MFSGELITLLVLLRFGCIIETVFAQQEQSHHSPTRSSSSIIVPATTTPTPLWLIEKYSKHDGSEHQHAVELWDGGGGGYEPWQDEQLQQERQQQQQQQKYVRGFQKRSVPGETPIPTSSPQCEPFENVDTEQKTLYSPGYPGNYPNHTDCHVVLEAPPGHLLRLDFRDHFHLEPSEDCKFDFIEIRDGGHGFSTLLGQYCGNEFPPMITSRERRLWLRFHSDENIEYKGFVVIYEFIPRPTSSLYEDTSCRFEMEESEGWVNSTEISTEKIQSNVEHSMPLDCMWVIKVAPGWKIQIAFLHFSLTHPNDCESNFVDVFGLQTDIPNRIKNFCGSIADSVTSKENVIHIRYYAEPQAVESKFEILYTAFRDKPIGQSCEEDEYDCEDATCISADLRCNGRVNCRFRWDEDECLTESTGQSDHVIIVIVVFTLILSTIFIAFIISCCQKLIRDHKIIRDHIRQSKESKLDELGRHSTKWSEKQQIQMECMSVKYPPPPLSPITRKEVINDEDSSHRMDRYGFHDHVMQSTPPPMKMSHGGGGSSYALKGSVTNIPTNDYEMEHFHHHHHPLKYQHQHQQQYQHQQQSLPPPSSTQSVGTAAESDASGVMCDMACQTRESLFQPIFNNNNSQTPTASSGHPPTHPRFSTFGYDHHPQQQQPHHRHQSTSGGGGSSSIGSGNSSSFDVDGSGGPKHAVASTTIDFTPAGHKQQHHRHCQHHPGGAAAAGSGSGPSDGDRGKSLPRRNNNNNNNNNNSNNSPASMSNRPNDTGGGTGMKEGHYNDVRKSAPDVIVMTSR